MGIDFKCVGRGTRLSEVGPKAAYLVEDAWDDFSYKTLYILFVYSSDGTRHRIGEVKIGFVGQSTGPHTKLPDTFKSLTGSFFSLGQDVEYYKNIRALEPELRTNVLESLNDIVNDPDARRIALEESVTGTSLLRNVGSSSITGQFKRILDGGAELTEFSFKFNMPSDRKTAGLELDFEVTPDSNPPTNVHVLIGRNGVGKTHLLNRMLESLIEQDENDPPATRAGFSALPDAWGNISEDPLFASVVSISFSAFDPFEPYPEERDKSKGIPFSYVGLKRTTNRGGKRGTLMSRDMLDNEFSKSLMGCVALGRHERWLSAITQLESDPLFSDLNLREKLGENDSGLKDEAIRIFRRLSSGHAVVLLATTKLVEKVEEKTLVLVDEPEGHLHPPLLAAFVRAVSDLLTHRNGVAIVATHSPVVLQEVPRECVWKISRVGFEATVERPEIETFGENVGVLTRESFGLELTKSGYHRLLSRAVEKEPVFEAVLRRFKGKLGLEAQAIVRALVARRGS